MPDYPFVKAMFYTPVARREVHTLMVHAMQGSEKPDSAEGCARYFAQGCPDAQGKKRRASAHYCIDSNSVVQCVRDMDVAYGCGGSNANTLHFEHAGMSEQSGRQWHDPYSQAMLTLSAGLFAQKLRQYNLPVVWRTIDDLKAGRTKGVTSHANASKAYGKSTHWDPGPNFPVSEFMAMIQAAYDDQDRDKITLMAGAEDVTRRFGAAMVNGHVVVGVKELCEHFNWEYQWEPRTRTLRVPHEFLGEE
jgi:hypothetical protein